MRRRMLSNRQVEFCDRYRKEHNVELYQSLYSKFHSVIRANEDLAFWDNERIREEAYIITKEYVRYTWVEKDVFVGILNIATFIIEDMIYKANGIN